MSHVFCAVTVDHVFVTKNTTSDSDRQKLPSANVIFAGHPFIYSKLTKNALLERILSP